MLLNDSRIQEIMEQLMAYARLDFDQKIRLDRQEDELTAIAAGVNMLGEELKENTISLREKERLLKELHHRVKNNMQIIVSMMRLQTVNETDPRILSFVRDSKSRIDSMALVHEMLYSSDGFEFTSLNEYVDFLQRSIFMSYAPPKHQITVNLKISDQCFFNIDRMIPIGLILNELFSNSLKHAFPQAKGGISLIAERLGKENNRIVYEDDGVGLPQGYVIEDAESLGMQLIVMLTEQLDGKLKFSYIGEKKGKQFGNRVEIIF